MLINLKVKTLDAQTHEFSIDNEITVREFKDQIAEKTNIAADQQRIIYCGRVLADEKQLKEYDVDGKVVHVAERPPPSQRAATSSSSAPLHPRGRPSARGGMRSSPMFRALDGMVVGTMAIPMNVGMNNGPMPVNPFTSSSSFCMNRITVARHMLECADNIAAYLEDPERGLNNTSLDILARGRWTMESTVVEVGITAADLPQNQNIVEMVQGAVSAALRRNANNVTVMQLPNVFGEGDPPAYSTPSATDAAEGEASRNDVPHAAVIIEDVTDAEENASTNASSTAAQVGSAASNSTSSTSTIGDSAAAAGTATEGANNATSTGTNTDDNPARSRTGTRVLAEVIEQMRNVQTRLNPFVQQFYDMLLNDPTFEANDITASENAQRLYDRVSEALHYLSHAQHAISDLMLDVSQPTPRYLTCRPIMVEQSGYVSSNNYLAAAAAAARQQQSQPAQQSVPIIASAVGERTQSAGAAGVSIPARAAADSTASTIAADAAEGTSGSEETGNGAVDDPIDEPVGAMPFALPVHVGTQSNDNHQVQMARLLQAVVNSAPIDTEFHVQINAPSIVSFGVPVNVGAAVQRQAQQQTSQQQAQSTASTAAASEQDAQASQRSDSVAAPTAASAPTETTPDQVRVHTATLPTTSTQTRSTSRPQLQIGNLPPNGFNGRFMMAAFDRFLPCNSHHIREPEQNNGNATGNANPANADAAASNTTQNQASAVDPTIGRPASDVRRIRLIRHLIGTPREQPPITDAYRSNLRTQLLNFLNEKIFEGGPINGESIPQAINRVVSWFEASLIYLPQYERPEYNSRDSVTNVLRRSLPIVIGVVNNEEDTLVLFERRLKNEFDIFFGRLYTVIEICVGYNNSRLYWGQLMRQLREAMIEHFRGEALQFLCPYINTESPRHADTIDVMQFLVRRDSAATPAEPAESAAPPAVITPMDTDIEMQDDVPCLSADPIDDVELLAEHVEIDTAADESLPSVIAGSEPWHRNFPNDWLPIITRDIETQAETELTQAPFSDAYISGMSAKRRKLVQSNKPPTDVRTLVADSVRRAIQIVGAGSSTASNQSQTADEITGAIANDGSVQASYTEAVRSNVRDRLKQEPDYKADKFPHITKFVNNK